MRSRSTAGVADLDVLESQSEANQLGDDAGTTGEAHDGTERVAIQEKRLREPSSK